MTLKSIFHATVATLLIAGPTAAPALDLSQLGINVPQHGQDMCGKQASHQFFNNFNCPLFAEAMWTGDASVLDGASRGERLAYMSAWVNAVHEPSIVWKVDPTVYSVLDPRLPMHVRYLGADPDAIGDMVGEGFNNLIGAFMGFAERRQQAMDSGTLDPIGEMSGLLGGMASTPKPIMLATQMASHDVMIWIGLAQRDPDAAIELYNGMRKLALEF
ncbi:MAG: hypothetical protein V2I76_06790 [Roseobacter sp.]|jgi:hypothetical protein|nr:hypothetical protein [Roseobacter sp.]